MEVTLNLEIFELSAAQTPNAQRFSARGLRTQAGSGHVRLPEELEKPGVFVVFLLGKSSDFCWEKAGTSSKINDLNGEISNIMGIVTCLISFKHWMRLGCNIHKLG